MKDCDFPYIYDLQRFSIHDGPGIRTVLFTKACPLSCLWCQNPESRKAKAEIAFYEERCSNCKKCIDSCPEGAIDPATMISNYSVCTSCGACVNTCHGDARRMIGRKMDKAEILEALLKDIDFFNNTGGGVTFSGGEPLMHSGFIYEIAKELKEYDIHVNVETCGHFNIAQVEKLLPYLDLIYFDLKHMNTVKHETYTGQGNETILQNLKKLTSLFTNTQVRIPVIPGVNDDEGHITEMCEYLSLCGHNTVHLLPYHSMGNSKAIRIDNRQELFKVKPCTRAELEGIQSLFSRNGINAKVYD